MVAFFQYKTPRVILSDAQLNEGEDDVFGKLLMIHIWSPKVVLAYTEC